MRSLVQLAGRGLDPVSCTFWLGVTGRSSAIFQAEVARWAHHKSVKDDWALQTCWVPGFRSRARWFSLNPVLSRTRQVVISSVDDAQAVYTLLE